MTTPAEDAIAADLLPWLATIIHDKSVKLEIHTPLISRNLIDSMDLLRHFDRPGRDDARKF